MEFFGILMLVCGLYCLYNFYKVRVKRNLDGYVLLPKDTNVDKMENKDAFIGKTSIPLLILGIVVTVSGAVDLYATRTGSLQRLDQILYVVSVIVIVWFLFMTRRWNREFFGKK